MYNHTIATKDLSYSAISFKYMASVGPPTSSLLYLAGSYLVDFIILLYTRKISTLFKFYHEKICLLALLARSKTKRPAQLKNTEDTREIIIIFEEVINKGTDMIACTVAQLIRPFIFRICQMHVFS